MKIVTPATLQDFDKYYQLRWEILRKPWGQPKGSEILTNEESSIHAMICPDEGKVTGVARLYFNSPAIAQVRFVAVDTNQQGKGIGKMLMTHLENIAKQKVHQNSYWMPGRTK
jgi:N-acetylglutamate synthase-like GNAT family acetyltransferase